MDPLKRKVTIALLSVTILGGVILRFWKLGGLPGINGDEIFWGIGWKTATGRPSDPFYLALKIPAVYFARAFRLDSWVWFRLPAVISGCFEVAAAALLLPRALSRSEAWITALLIAGTPMCIAYSRIGWELSQVGLVTVLTCGFALRGQWGRTVAAALAGVLVHTTTVLAWPISLTLGAQALFRRLKMQQGPEKARSLFVAVLLILMLALIGYAVGSSVPASYGHPFADAWARVSAPGEFWDFSWQFARLILGYPAYADFAGANDGEQADAATAAVLMILALTFAAGMICLVRLRDGKRTGFLAGWLWSYLAFYAFAGKLALLPGYERFALFIVVPTLLMFAIALRAVCARFFRDPMPAVGIASLLSVAGLFFFQQRYVLAIEDGTSRVFPAYRTGEIEPKLVAFRWISERRAGTAAAGVGAAPGATSALGEDTTTIIAENWYLYWPLAELALRQPRFKVRHADALLPAGLPHEDYVPFGELAAQVGLGAYVVTFAGSSLDDALAREALGNRWLTHEIAGFSGSPILRIWAAR